MAKSDMLVRIQADAKSYDANIAKASRTLEQFKKDNLSLGGIMKQSTTQLTAMAAQFMGVAAAVGAAKKVIGDMVRINKEFEQSSSNLAAVMGKTRDEITALTSQAKQLGATTQYTANQILELQANLARLGFNETEILNSTKAVQAMATAMGADLGEAANLAGSALRGFGLDATQMDRVASVLSVGTTKSALSFEKLATALPIVQTAAAKTGFTIEDTVAMLGKLTDNGINAASAATQLRKILNDSTTAGTKLANALGGPVKSFDELVVALDKANKAGQNHADSVALVNSKNATALDILRDMAAQRTVEIDGVQKQTSALQDLRDSITDCSDGMRAMQDEQLNTLQGSITILGSAWEGLMLTFSESNGTIKTVVDSLTDLLTAWTKWRNRNAGGDSAIQTYEIGLSDASKQAADAAIKNFREQGKSDEEIAQTIQAEVDELAKKRDAMKAVLVQWEQAEKATLSGREKDKVLPQLREVFGDEFIKKNPGKKLTKAMQLEVAHANDILAAKNYMISTVTPSESTTTTTTEDGKDEDRTKSRLATLKAQYEEQEKAQIASLDRMAMNEADYEAEVYKIKRETLQKIADLYQDETAEKARANAAISQLDIAYQGTQMRLAKKGSKSTKTYETQTGPSGYSEEGISALRNEIQGGMKSMQMGSSEYMVEANRLVDLASFENLLKAAVQAGVEIDPNLLETNFEKIDLGVDVTPEEWQTLTDTINAQLKELGLDPIELDVQTGGVSAAKEGAKATADAWQNAVAAVNNVGSALQQIEDPAAKVAGIVMQAVANIALGFAQAVASPATGAAGVFGWIAAATAGLATMVSTIAAIKSATSGAKGYAEGGMVGGNSYSGDNIVARLNSGEGVLTAQGVQNAASMAANSNPMQNLQLSTEISGTNLRVVLNNDNRSKGGSRGYYANIH